MSGYLRLYLIWGWAATICLGLSGMLGDPEVLAQQVYIQHFDERPPGTPLEGWTRYDEPLAEAKPSLWVIKSYLGRTALAQISNIYAPGVHARGTWVVRKEERWADATVEVLMTCTDNDVVSVLFRYVDPQNFYVVDMTDQKRPPEEGQPSDRWVRIQKCQNGSYQLLALAMGKRTYRSNDGIWHQLRLEMRGNHFRFAFDGETVLEAEDPAATFPEGSIGLGAWAQSSVLFDDLRVDGVVVDDFDREVPTSLPEGWRAYEEPGAREGPAHWQVDRLGDASALVQYANVHKPNDARRGTWVVLDGYSWQRMTLDWDMYNTDDDIPGVLFHYRDPENFYILEMSLQPRPPDLGMEPTSWVRIRRCAAGQYTVLGWTTEGVYQKYTWHHGRIETTGSQIRVWIDQKRILEVADPNLAHVSGTVGFSSYAQQRVAFDNLQVVGPLAIFPRPLLRTTWGRLKIEGQDSP